MIAETRRNLHHPKAEWDAPASSEPIDPKQVVDRLNRGLDEAAAFVSRMPTEKMGLLFLKDGEVVQPDPDWLDEYEAHAERCGGQWPSDPNIQHAMLERYTR